MRFTYTSGARPLDGYTIKRGIGIGGFGEVYFATSDAGKEVALKRVQRNLEVEVRGVSHCLNLKHVNLISLYDIKYDDQGEAWVVMEYVAGQRLKDVLDRNPNGMPADEALHWFRGMAQGVAYLHDNGIVHRDLKPGNIFCDDGVVKIGDYGLAKFISCSRRSGQTESVGTFHYMAPEIGKGSYGREIDIYALGVILHEMLTGRVPFDGESSQEIIMKHLTADPDVSGLDEPFRSVVARALRKDPERRFASVTDMLDALEGKSPVDPPDARLPETSGAARGAVPPVRQSAPPDLLYIGDDEPAEEMVFGPVRQRPSSLRVPPVTTRPLERPAARAGVATSAAQGSLLRSTRDGWQDLVNAVNNSGYGTPLKILLLILGAVAVLLQPMLLVPITIAGVGYLAYRGGLYLTGLVRRRRDEGLASAERQSVLRASARRALSSRAPSERFSELTGALFLAAIVCSILCLLMVLLSGADLDWVRGWSHFVWLTLVGTAGAWALLACGRLWQSSEAEGAWRRLTMLGLGLLLGLAAWGSAQFLQVAPHSEHAFVQHSPESMVPANWYQPGGVPRLPVYLAYFGGLFALVRWWRMVDPFRKSRFSLAATGICLLWAWIVHFVVMFPQPWGVMLAAAIAVAAQLAAPWMNSTDRAEARRFA